MFLRIASICFGKPYTEYGTNLDYFVSGNGDLAQVERCVTVTEETKIIDGGGTMLI